MDIKINSATNFKSGMNAQILRMERNIIPRQIENYFCNMPTKDWRSFYNIDFKDNKAMATANRLCVDIFNNMRKIFDYRNGYCMQNLTSPQDIFVFNNEDSNLYGNRGFFAIGNDIKIEENLPTFQKGTTFFSNTLKKLDNIDALTEQFYKDGKTSSPHFLNPFIHEWLHSIFYKTVSNICYNGIANYNATIENYNQQKLTDKEKEIVSDIVSLYPANCDENQFAETFADSWTKFICDALADDCKTFKKNPLDLVKATPKEFQEILKKVSSVDFIVKPSALRSIFDR